MKSTYVFKLVTLIGVTAENYIVGFSKLSLEVCLTHPSYLDSKNENVNEYLKYLEVSLPMHPSLVPKIEEVGKLESKPPREKSPKLELKPLPSNLRYTFFG